MDINNKGPKGDPRGTPNFPQIIQIVDTDIST